MSTYLHSTKEELSCNHSNSEPGYKSHIVIIFIKNGCKTEHVCNTDKSNLKLTLLNRTTE